MTPEERLRELRRRPNERATLASEAPAPEVPLRPHEIADTLEVPLSRWDGPRLEIVGLYKDDVQRVTWVDHDEAGRPVRFDTAVMHHNARGVSTETAECEWDGDRCVRVRWRESDDGEHWWDHLDEGEYDERGLRRVRRDEVVVWDRAVDGIEEDPLPPDEALAVWVEAVAEAAARTVELAAIPEGSVLKVVASFRSEPPAVVVVDRERLEREGAREAVRLANEPRMPLTRELSPEGLRALRSLRTLRVLHDDRPEVGDALTRRLAAMSWPGGAIAVAFGLGGDAWKRALGGLPEAPPREPSGDAQWGLLLDGGGRGRSHLGGGAELPEGMPWPASEGRPLTHLATIDLSELPEFEGRELLPAEGDLVFFADLSYEGELWEPTVVGEDERVRVLHVVGPTHEPAPPPGLRRRDIRFRPVLTVPESDDPDLIEPGHLILGHPEFVQGDPREPGQVSLLHLGWDEALGFEYLDGADLTFYGDAEDVRAGRWERLTVEPQSG